MKKYNKKLYVQNYLWQIWFKIQKSMIVFFGHLKYPNFENYTSTSLPDENELGAVFCKCAVFWYRYQ